MRYFCGTNIHAMSMVSHKISWWDISVVKVFMLCQWYLTKLVGEIFLWYKYPCYDLDFKLSLSQSVIYRFLDVMWCDVMWWYKYPCYVNDTSRNLVVIFFCGISIHSMSATSYKISWWDIFVVQVSMLCQWFLTKLVGEIFLWYKYPGYVNDILRR